MTFLRRIIHENNNLLFYYNVSSSLFFTFRFITTVKTLTHCDHGNYFLRRSKGSFLESSVTAVFRIHNTARNISQKNSNNLKHLTKCLWYQIWPLVKAIDTRICSPLFKKHFLAAITNARNTTPEFHITVTEWTNFVKVSVHELFWQFPIVIKLLKPLLL